MQLHRLHQPLQFVRQSEANARVVVGSGPDPLDFCYSKFDPLPVVGDMLTYMRGSFALAHYKVMQIVEGRHPDTEEPMAVIILEFVGYV